MQTRTITSSSSLRHGWLVRAAGALLAIGAIAALPTRAQAGVYVSVNIAPPILPIYEQPLIPGPGYLWTPGYWAWGGDGYYWVPGTWVLPPYVGALWTPGYWGWGDGVYVFHRGYWGRHVGFYGGIDYGYGYGGRGYEGGYWRGGGFYYNRSVNRVGGNIRNVYNRTVIRNATFGNNRRASFNGGPGGIAARPTSQERGWEREQHRGPVAAQLQQRSMASRTPSLRAATNHGAPPIAATPRAGAFRGRGIATAHDAPRSEAMHDAGAMRSASFAPHANQSVRSPGQSRYGASTSARSYARPNNNYTRNRESGAERGTAYQPQDARATRYQPQASRAARYQPQASRPAPGYARGGYRPANPRPAEAHAAAPRGHAAAPARGDRRDDHHH